MIAPAIFGADFSADKVLGAPSIESRSRRSALFFLAQRKKEVDHYPSKLIGYKG
jgi:hypothetical protein